MITDEYNIKWKAFLSGDKEAFTWIYSNSANVLYKYGHHFTNDTELIKDAIQEVFTHIYQIRATIEVNTSIKCYLFSSMHNILLNALARKNKIVSFDSEEELYASFQLEIDDTAQSDQSNREMREKVNKLLSVLSPRQKEIIYYRYVQELDYDDICKLMNMNYQSAQNLLQRSFKKIKLNSSAETLYIALILIRECVK